MSLSHDIFDLDRHYDHWHSLSRAVTPTHARFPSSDKVMEDVGTPFGCEIVPFLPIPSSRIHSDDMIDAETVLRCSNCSAYISPLCRMEFSRWICVLCGSENSMTRSQFMRFKGNRDADLSVRDYAFALQRPSKKFQKILESKFQHLHLSQEQQVRHRVFQPSIPPPPSTLQIRMAESRESNPTPSSSMSGLLPLESHSSYFSPVHRRPLVHVFMLPARMGPDVMEGIVDSLMAGIQAMHPDLHVVLLSYSDVIEVYSLHHYHSDQEDDPIPVKLASYTDFDDAPTPFDDFFQDDVPIQLTKDMYVNIDDTLDEDDPILGFAQHSCLSEVADFLETAMPLRFSKEVLLRALESFGERCLKSNRSRRVPATKSNLSINEDALLNSDVERAVLSVVDWILCYESDHHQPHSDTGEDSAIPDHTEEEDYDLLGREERKGLWGSIKSWFGLAPSALQSEFDNTQTRWLSRRGPIDDCSGVVLHVFITQEVRRRFKDD